MVLGFNTCVRRNFTIMTIRDTPTLTSRIAACNFNGIYNSSDVDDQINILNGNLDETIPKVMREAAVNCES